MYMSFFSDLVICLSWENYDNLLCEVVARCHLKGGPVVTCGISFSVCIKREDVIPRDPDLCTRSLGWS